MTNQIPTLSLVSDNLNEEAERLPIKLRVNIPEGAFVDCDMRKFVSLEY